ncbi:BdrC3-like protein [Prochlorococcus marinus str. MIT 9312]|uniref:BdrC3-like protein n=1 Tax=Prochlorococcus marinus (strain MIT 9312) TaxID=74546 RepID=Q31B64_PROM9|nr:hypothetical protein [Prochlorococcus marinus]ABB49881.1 BdrC3-like protein [Prochlorococcus marinus str. MIT 9312]KGF99127.1 putative BdrC3 [Prochlorococcus marinus str. MIT 9311]
MPTKKKRVGFIPREDVYEIIDKLSTENNLSNSKIISILVEEALSIRGIFNKNTGKVTEAYTGFKDSLDFLTEDPTECEINKKLTINTKLVNDKNSGKTTLLKRSNQDSFDLQTYKKFLSFLKFQEMMDKYNT